MQNLNNQPLTEVEIIIKKIESGEMTNAEYFEEIARSEASCAAKQVVPKTFIGAGLFGLGFLLQLSTFQLGGLAIFAGWMVWSKIRRATRGQADINAGNVEEYLPPEDVEYYRLALALDADNKREAAAAQRKAEQEKAIAPSSPMQANALESDTQTAIALPTPESHQGGAAIAATSLQQAEPLETPAPKRSRYPELDLGELRHYPSIIIFGAQGSAKTSLARAIAYDRIKHGHEIAVLDPHSVQWAQFRVIGSGMDYPAIERACKAFKTETFNRYKIASQRVKECIAQKLPQAEIERKAFDFTPITLIADEFTNWSDRLDPEVAVQYIKTAWTDIRKVKLCAVFISHSNTLEGGLAGAKGLANLRDNGSYQIELFSESVNGKAVPTGEGLLYRPRKEPVNVSIWNLLDLQNSEPNAPSANNNPEAFAPDAPPAPAPEENADSVGAHPSTHAAPTLAPDPHQCAPESAPNPHPTAPEAVVQSSDLSIDDRIKLLGAQNFKIEDIVFRLWNITKGGNDRYKNARDYVKKVLGVK